MSLYWRKMQELLIYIYRDLKKMQSHFLLIFEFSAIIVSFLIFCIFLLKFSKNHFPYIFLQSFGLDLPNDKKNLVSFILLCRNSIIHIIAHCTIVCSAKVSKNKVFMSS